MQGAISDKFGHLGCRILSGAKEALGFLDLQRIDILQNRFSVLALEFAADGGFIRGEEEAEAIQGDLLGEMLVDILGDMRDDRVAAIADVEEGALVLFAADQGDQKLLEMVFQKLIGTEGIGFALFHIGGVWHIVGRHIDGHTVLEDLGEKLFFRGRECRWIFAEMGKLRRFAREADDDHTGSEAARAGEAMHLACAMDQKMAIIQRAGEALTLDGESALIGIDELTEIVRIGMRFIFIGELKIMNVCNPSDG